MTDLETLFPEADDREEALLLNIDHLVEVGVPREVAERACHWAFDRLDETITKTMVGMTDQFPDMKERAVARALYLGGIHNWLPEKISMVSLALNAVIELYQGEQNNG